ncbi:MAG: hypothetical protein CLLPBCKN_006147 [Chroococcidiopsis cubana SAG 39.79]|uniref:Transposase IS66 C-terminal domain-containing protein n=1 Tax=Chroococcidiopsis cubana SAG 39.79 TaxID=388085 RepID=A0AB37UH77_9CYAN|nr:MULTISPECIES: hypothetical protein [Chroococcidiopsis]MDV2997970.1 hypothetical protein [Chroococcidiopsis sp. SAG 2025]MDZ4876712.1 hypothetical protein [Chroococcidiopsis cubana SAG 39.79]RUT10548.1 hypothetical protein DSM107010_41150 [Chroococcidiopsis cubana SAG 39.79]
MHCFGQIAPIVGIDDKTLFGKVWQQTEVTLSTCPELLQLDLAAFVPWNYSNEREQS